MNRPPSPTPAPAHRSRKAPPTLSLLPLALPLRSTSSSRLVPAAEIHMWNDSTKTPRYRPLKPNPGNGEANRALNEDNIDKAKSKLDKESQKGKGKRTNVAYVGVAAHPGSGEEGDGKVEIDEPDVCDSLEIASEEVYRKEDGVNDMISWQIRQPTHTVNPNNLDSLLPLGIGDYTFVTSTRTSTSSPGNSLADLRTRRVSLGKGKFSEVLLARKGDVEYALKHTSLHQHHPLIATRLLREPSILAQLIPHPNLIEVFETIRTPGHFYLVEENLQSSITLEGLISSSTKGILEPGLAWSILNQLASVVRSLHEPLRVCHRDIKPENILVRLLPPEVKTHGQTTVVLKLLDFGLATHYSSSEAKLTTCCGSPAYHSPELWKGLREPSGTVKYWGPEVDIWCLGLTLLRCLTPNKYPLGVSHSSLNALSDKIIDTLLAVQDVSLRKTIAGFLHMDGQKRMRYFQQFCADLESKKVAALASPKTSSNIPLAKEFKSTTFLPAELRHSLDLPLLTPRNGPRSLESVANGLEFESHSQSQYRHRSRTNLLLDLNGPPSPMSGPPSAVPSPDLTPDMSSPWATLHESLPSTPETPISDHLPYPPAIELFLLNPTNEPIRRAASYIKYALRCAGILYHVRDDVSSSGFSSETFSPSPDLTGDNESFVCYLQCVVKMPIPDHSSKASSALIAALRPGISRAHTTGNSDSGLRSSSTPPTGKKAASKSADEDIKALVFFVSIKKVEQAVAREGRPGESRSRRSRKRKDNHKIVLSFSDERAVDPVRDALKGDTDAELTPRNASPLLETELEIKRGRKERAGTMDTAALSTGNPATTTLTGLRTHSTSRSRDAHLTGQSRSRRGSKLSEEIVIPLGTALGMSMGLPSGSAENLMEKIKSTAGFFDYAFGRFQGLARPQAAPQPELDGKGGLKTEGAVKDRPAASTVAKGEVLS